MRPLLTTVIILATLTPTAHAARPNVLIVLLDDLGYSDLGCYGGEIPTPHIDKLAANGARFTQMYNSARCCPSRAALMTGLHPHLAGIGSFTFRNSQEARKGPAFRGSLNDQCVTLAEVLKTAGYNTYMSGKWHMGDPGPIARGFDEFYGYRHDHSHNQFDRDYYVRRPSDRKPELDYDKDDYYATDAFNDYAMEFLKQARAKDKPWLLYVAHSSPHFPVQAPAESVEPFVKTYERGWDALRTERFARQKAIGLADDSWRLTPRSLVPVDRKDIANGYPGVANPAWAALPADRRADLARRMAIFAAMVKHVDDGVGRIIADLEKHNELHNTLVLVLSDNGACYEWGPFGFDGRSRTGKTTLHTGDALAKMGGPDTHHSYGSGWANLGNTPLRMYKHFTHEGGIGTPFIVHWPKGIGTPDRWVREPCHLMDIMPTICEATGAVYPKTRKLFTLHPLEGVSLLPAARGKRIAERAIAFEHQGARALRKGPWKIVWSKREPGTVAWQLYNIDTDRCETTDLAAKHPQRVSEMAAEWDAWGDRVKAWPFWKPAPSETGPR